MPIFLKILQLVEKSKHWEFHFYSNQEKVRKSNKYNKILINHICWKPNE